MQIPSSVAVQNARETATAPKFETERNVGGAMGKHDFLMLLVTQLRHQNPLEPTNDNDFGAQLAQFSQLEQLENMNQSMALMALQQSYSMIGKFVVGEAVIQGERVEVFGIVESIYTHEGVTYAQLQGYEFGVPVSGITAVVDSSDFVNPRMLIEISNSLVGREVRAEYRVVTDLYEDEEDEERITDQVVEVFQVHGVVTSVYVYEGALFAKIVDDDGKEYEVPVGSIYDIGQFKEAAAKKEPDPLTGYEHLIGQFVETNMYETEVDGVRVLLPIDENAPAGAVPFTGKVLGIEPEGEVFYAIIAGVDGHEWKVSAGSIISP